MIVTENGISDDKGSTVEDDNRVDHIKVCRRHYIWSAKKYCSSLLLFGVSNLMYSNWFANNVEFYFLSTFLFVEHNFFFYSSPRCDIASKYAL